MHPLHPGSTRAVLRWLPCLVLLAASPSAVADLPHRSGPQWFPCFEWSLTNPTWTGNPFDVAAHATFRHTASGEARRTGLFYCGKNLWSFRFTGTQTGDWTFSVTSDDPELNGHQGRVTVTRNPDARAHGFLKSFGNKWGWQGTEEAFVPQLAMWDYIAGSNDPREFHGQPDGVDAKIQEFLQGHGFTGFHVSVIGGRWFDFAAANDRVQAAMTEPDARTFEAMEMLITRVHAAGGMVHLWLWGDHQRSQTPRSLAGGIGGAIDRRFQRYLAARLGPLPGWSAGYGFDLDEWVTADELRTWRDMMHAELGWPHFLGGRPAGPNRGLDHTRDAAWNRGLDYGSYEHHQPGYAVYRAALEALPTQPVLSEDRFRIRNSPYPEKDYTEQRVRRGLYDSTLAGGVGNIWGISPELSPGGVFPDRDQLKTYAVFFFDHHRFLADLEAANPLSADPDTRVLLSPATGSLVIYREATDRVSIDLSALAEPAPAVAVNTRAAYAEIPLGDLGPGQSTLRLPEVSDWVIAIGKFARD